MPGDFWQQTVDVSVSEGVLSGPPADGVFTTEFAEAALELLGDADTTGEGFERIEVTLNEGGE